MGKIEFGTDGWRAIIGQDFTQENVTKAVNAIGKYVKDTFGLNKHIIIGYDPRNMADEFSKLTAEILVAAGFTVTLSQRVVPTPVLAYNAKLMNACAIMFTASHNPPEYLGIKFIPDYAGPATDDITAKIVDNIGQTLIKTSGGKLEFADFYPTYAKEIEKFIDFDRIKTFGKNFIFNGFYSATIGYFDRILESHGIGFERINMLHDKNFGGKMPDPKPQYMEDLISLIKQKKDYVGFANDGDGDRFGIINEEGQYVSPNEIIAILLMHLTQHKNLTGAIVKTVGSSFLLNKVAEKLGVEVVETAVGFKHVGEAMRKFNPIIGGEESGGLSIQGHIPEKDGIIANLLVLEAMAYSGKSLCQLQKDLYTLAGCKFYNSRIDIKSQDRAEISAMLDKFKNTTNIGEFIVEKVDLTDGVKLFFTDGESWILTRPSGTEPLLRIYFETGSPEKLETLKRLLNN